MPSQTQKPVIKAEGDEHSGPTFKPDNTEYGFLGRDPKGWGHLNAHLCYEPLIWPTKPHDSRLAARPNDRQRHSRTIAGHSLSAAKPDYASNGSRRIMVSLRSGPVEIMSTGTPVSSSMRLM
ncbi:hypothetical protein EBA31_00905 [Serratia sp. P2ACOL2]|nr:hypothetical protein EBA31_00905 [Serratia sp. P2ACOL2]